MKRKIYLVEGETEKKFIKAFQGKYFISGKIQKFNLWNRDINKIIINLKCDILIVVYDTDEITNLSRFKDNIEILKKHVTSIILISQDKNLEDELNKSLNKTMFDIFGVDSKKELKNKFMKTNNILEKLEKSGYNNTKIWNTKYMENQIKRVVHDSNKIKKQDN